MKYMIDSADLKEIEEAAAMGVYGITANPSMYLKCGQPFYPFLRACLKWRTPFLSGEVMETTMEKMLPEAERILAIDPGIVIKINFSKEGLKLCRYLSQKGVRCAVTLIFTIAQAAAAAEAGASYVFPFVGRTDEYGADGLKLVLSVQRMLRAHNEPTNVVAASIKNLRQLEELAAAGVDYAAVSYALFERALCHPLTESGLEAFQADWKEVAAE